MKKNVLTMLMVAFLCSLVNAQVGINIPDGDEPQATLQIDGNPSTTTTPDGIIVPRLTAAQLALKDSTYGTTQDGAIVFITSGVGISTGKTSQITGKGFYYYNSTTSKWEPLTPPVSTPKVVRIEDTSLLDGDGAYVVQPEDDIILITKAGNTMIKLPTTGVPVGKTVRLSAVGHLNSQPISIDIRAAENSTFAGYREYATQSYMLSGFGTQFTYTGVTDQPNLSYVPGSTDPFQASQFYSPWIRTSY